MTATGKLTDIKMALAGPSHDLSRCLRHRGNRFGRHGPQGFLPALGLQLDARSRIPPLVVRLDEARRRLRGRISFIPDRSGEVERLIGVRAFSSANRALENLANGVAVSARSPAAHCQAAHEACAPRPPVANPRVRSEPWQSNKRGNCGALSRVTAEHGTPVKRMTVAFHATLA